LSLQWIINFKLGWQSARRWFRPLTQGISATSLLTALLLHGLLLLLFLQWRVPVVAAKKTDNPPMITVQIVDKAPTPQVLPVKKNAQAQPAPSSAASAGHQPKTATKRHHNKADRQSAGTVATTRPGPVPAEPAANVTSLPNAASSKRLNTDALLDNYISQYQTRPLDNAELQQIQQSKTSRQLTASEPAASAAPAAGWHADVAAVLDDGSQIVRLSADRCVIADAGADLRKDIHSIRGTPCPDNNTDTALFERIMAKIGTHRP
jgi:hypothetical protein